MRELKFRIWDKGTKCMHQPVLQLVNGEQTPFPKLAKTPGAVSSPKNWTWLQYTGLKDKNGVEIYEGDIVETHAWEGVIEMSHTGAYVIAQGSFKELLHDYVHNKWDIEVIGNIYENPDLLDAKGGGTSAVTGERLTSKNASQTSAPIEQETK